VRTKLPIASELSPLCHRGLYSFVEATLCVSVSPVSLARPSHDLRATLERNLGYVVVAATEKHPRKQTRDRICGLPLDYSCPSDTTRTSAAVRAWPSSDTCRHLSRRMGLLDECGASHSWGYAWSKCNPRGLLDRNQALGAWIPPRRSSLLLGDPTFSGDPLLSTTHILLRLDYPVVKLCYLTETKLK
jgi:hypothetical protein